MKKSISPDETAAIRMQLITPLLEPSLDPQSIIERKKEICNREGISYRTVSRYLSAYQAEGFEGLKPKVSYHQKESRLPEDFPQLLEEAIILRRECPSRSVNDIIRILELEDRIEPGSLSRSTLQRHMQSRGYGTKQMKQRVILNTVPTFPSERMALRNRYIFLYSLMTPPGILSLQSFMKTRRWTS